MTYLSGNRDRRKRNTAYIIGGVALILLVIFWVSIKRGLFPVLEPVVEKYSLVKNGFGLFPEFMQTYFRSHKDLALKNKSLQNEVERLENLVAEKDGQLRELSLIVGTSTTKFVPPTVLYPLMEDSLKIYSTVLLSKGFKDGIEVGDIAYIKGREAVCTIKEVYNSTSLCLLFTASDVTTEGVTASSSITLNLIGRGGYYLANIVRDTPLSVGEKVYMRDNPHLLLGEVTDVLNNNQDTSWHAFVRSAYNPVTTSVFYVQQ